MREKQNWLPIGFFYLTIVYQLLPILLLPLQFFLIVTLITILLWIPVLILTTVIVEFSSNRRSEWGWLSFTELGVRACRQCSSPVSLSSRLGSSNPVNHPMKGLSSSRGPFVVFACFQWSIFWLPRHPHFTDALKLRAGKKIIIKSN